MAVRKNGGGSSSVQVWKRAGESSGERGKGVVKAGGAALPFIWARGRREGDCRGVTTGVNGWGH
jgi:hypothetical protein